ncbi:hypothetical protein K1719_002176 [Acacia pycnantha]|nr:hypothetical protein K1719_002176 [Acacia pycnantha]
MVLWEFTVATVYFLGLNQTYRLALKLQRKIISVKHPNICQFARRSSLKLFHSSQAYGMNEEFSRILSQPMEYYSNDPNADRINRLEGEMSQMKNRKEFLLTDTVGFIQKLPTTLVAAFRATLEEISESSLLVHVVDISHPLSEQQIDAVDKVLSELNVSSIPRLMVWNKVDKASDPQKIRKESEEREDVVCISALNGDVLLEFCNAVQEKLKVQNLSIT